ncbi:MAG: biotin/lipoate--protein ligase family protein [Rhodospirillales bacterium]|nr:biotin/lipoate--protein ligase family protein [Rhodospirillales bacterium]MDP6774153.1 biotin/lipoate--protein ligase family protein [Rhodospirillales bacterium]
MTARPRVPPAYRLVTAEEAGDAVAEARRRAAEGAEDGTLVWAPGPPGAADGNLHCAVILRPDEPEAAADQFVFVGALALGDAIGALITPGFDIACRWPGRILVQGGVVAEAAVGIDAADTPEWIVVGAEVFLTEAPERPQGAVSFVEQCSERVDAVEMLEAFSRHFLVWTNTWMDGGFAPLGEAWKRRAQGLGEDLAVGGEEEAPHGTFSDIDDGGRLILVAADGTRHAVRSAGAPSALP